MTDETRDNPEQQDESDSGAEEAVAREGVDEGNDVELRLVSTNSGDEIGHDEVIEGLGRELRAQRQVVDILSEQREPEGLNIAKVLDSAEADVGLLMAAAVTDRTADIIGPSATKARRDSIREQISLPISAAFKMCIRSIWVRIGRVAITASGIFLGIAFYASVSTTALVLEVVAVEGEQVAGDQARQTWLIVMALLVSVVGIRNSMPMAVAERFREIGTMKCLGALDGFIVKIFLIEFGMLGVLAGLGGSVVGGGVMYLVNSMRYDFSFGDVRDGDAGDLVRSMIFGSVLSVVAAILPARQAAQMPAAVALRTDV